MRGAGVAPELQNRLGADGRGKQQDEKIPERSAAAQQKKRRRACRPDQAEVPESGAALEGLSENDPEYACEDCGGEQGRGCGCFMPFSLSDQGKDQAEGDAGAGQGKFCGGWHRVPVP